MRLQESCVMKWLLSIRYRTVSKFLKNVQVNGLTFKELYIVDSTTIRLFRDIIKGVGKIQKMMAKRKVD